MNVCAAIPRLSHQNVSVECNLSVFFYFPLINFLHLPLVPYTKIWSFEFDMKILIKAEK